MNNSDIFRKSDLGREEIKNQEMGVLPREARTLLILIDGKKTYQRYFESLDKSKMFVETGGIVPLFELLQDLQYIELVEQAQSISPEQKTPMPKPVGAALSNEDPKAPLVQPPQPSPSQKLPSQSSSEAEFDNTFNSQEPNKTTSISNYFKGKEPDSDYEKVKSDLATYIEKNAPPQDAWGYLLSLEQCKDDSQLLALVQRIQKSTSGGLSRGMDKFSKTLKR
ncbi:hypothetical protein [Psychrobacter sp. 72-O-c]|uniref:hypothetical protein n=1 Tax=Psychrobacter sp. 72-O-c TaxID=2774125 RepID=UPI00191B8656|nr:hypothetical protein [Psychrobacter sp. 72-O-c]